MQANGGEFAADELVPTDAADFSAYLLKIRNAKPDLVVSNLAGAQITNFMKQYMEYGLPYPRGRIRLRHRGRVGRGQGQRDRHLAAGVGPPGQDAVARRSSPTAFTKKYGKPPDNQAWGDYLSTKHLAQAMTEIKTHRLHQGRRAPGEGRQVRRAEDARGLLPQLGSPADAGDVHDTFKPAARSRTSGICSRRHRRCRRRTRASRSSRRRARTTTARCPPDAA